MNTNIFLLRISIPLWAIAFFGIALAIPPDSPHQAMKGGYLLLFWCGQAVCSFLLAKRLNRNGPAWVLATVFTFTIMPVVLAFLPLAPPRAKSAPLASFLSAARPDAGRKWRFWGEAQELPCPFCGKEMERARLQMIVSGGNFDLMAMAASYDTSKGGRHVEQQCESCGETFESRLAPDSDARKHGKSFHQWRQKRESGEER